MVHECIDKDMKEIKDRVKIALRILFKNDSFLLEHDVHEISIAHKLAEYLQILFPDWNVDLEYNRRGKEQKRTHDRNELIRPDIIIHKRGKQDNLLVIESKKYNNCSDEDIMKLEYLTNQNNKYKYKLGLFIRFGKTSKSKHKLRWFKDGKEINKL
ncbi:MAG: hypothetical protein KatS3mg003_0191 [Candidatus Nitrosocaldaceae archaeon]|nr:MAG: hypothetical protein KatS3mg003_0191 [Candidatus Nitrosocaldaceae archaeon]